MECPNNGDLSDPAGIDILESATPPLLSPPSSDDCRPHPVAISGTVVCSGEREGSAEYAFAGAASGALTRCLAQPLDVIKIRFQLQVEPVSKSAQSKYSGVLQCTRCVLREEGWRALWKGHIPAQVLSIFMVFFFFSCYFQYTSFELFTKAAWLLFPAELTTSQWRPVTHLLCGSLSGGVATFIIQPVDVLRTRFIAQGEPKVHLRMHIFSLVLDACKQIWRSEGAYGFYKGLSPALLQVMPQMGLQFGFYSLFTGLWNKSKGTWLYSAPDQLESIVCGTGSGLLSKLFIYPMDVVKKRLQIQGFESARQGFGATRQYSGMISCLLQISSEEGVRGERRAGAGPGDNSVTENLLSVAGLRHRGLQRRQESGGEKPTPQWRWSLSIRPTFNTPPPPFPSETLQTSH
ncbi:hypothetical protein C0Q70_00227 [Pomacea canaliculata]|uniref:Mitochondrial thiamine pyrophosphate carrier n=1 Tax=Pomacea canaliculata TaxID=400727 RepID=A0A2T7PW57_POMCA|nr:hypothetical protein C0Q70_00227 [Pomacea canaliculata]